ncbi:MAG: DNA-3-methyladenine glycosylase I, partial [Pseudomonadota bacterium]
MTDLAKPRCFGSANALYAEYHDEEWGVPVHDDRTLFEMLILEGAHAGLSWETILRKREGYRKQFHNFDVDLVAQMSDEQLDAALHNAEIVRHRQKIASTRKNAQ